MLLVINAHDIELNPGPYKPKFPCQMCSKAVKWGQRGVRCDSCLGWYHTECMGMGTHTYEDLDGSRVLWICHSCGIPNYSACHMFTNSSIETYNSFSSLDTVNDENELLLSPPAATSSPIDKQCKSKSWNTRKVKVDALRILVVNCQSIRAKRESLHTCVDSYKPQIIIGSESWLDDSISNNEVFPPDFSAFRKDRVHGNDSRGGVFVALRNDIIGTHQVDYDTDCEVIWVQIQLVGCKNIVIGAFYRPPSLDDPDYLERLRTSLSRINTSNGTVIALGGDFNLGDINWDNCSVPSGAKKVALSELLLEIANQFNLTQMVKEPTRHNRILDIFFTSNPTLVNNSSVIPGVSDHDGIAMIDMLTKPKYNKPKPRKLYQYHKADLNGLKESVKELSQKISSNADSTVEEDWVEFRDGLSECMDSHIPFKFSSSRNETPWITHNIKRQLRRKQRAFNHARATGRDDDLEKFHAIRKETQRASKRAYWKWVRTRCVESSKQFWSFVKKLRRDSMGIPALRKDGLLVSDDVGKAEILNAQFESVFTSEEPMDNLPSSSKSYPIMPDIHVSLDGVVKLLSELQENKAPGPDGLSPKILKLCAEEVAPALTSIFNKSMLTGELPCDWLTANISPIHKKGDRAAASNYRPVSLTPICCKMFEHIIHSNIMRHFDKHQVLTHRQHGFRSKHSCESQLILTIHDLAKSLDCRTPLDMIIMDFSKAFDTVPHNRLLHKLHSYGITGNTHKWITNFLTKRTQRVVVNGEHSKWVHVKSGVPQGTVMGPLLFLIYLNDLPDNISSEVRLFADDCVLYRPITNDIDIEHLQTDLNTLTQWQNTWQMHFNADKCFVLKISHAKTTSLHQYTLGQSVLKELKSHSYLGVNISHDLKWVDHINSTISKANRVLGVIRRNFHSCPTELKATAYKSLVRPHLEYSGTVWDPYTDVLIQKLEAVQRRAARFVCRDYSPYSSVTTMLKNLEWDTLQLRRKAARLTMMHKIVNGQVAIPASDLLLPAKRPSRHSNSKSFIWPRTKKDCFKNSFIPRTIHEWNSLPEHLVNINLTGTFKEEVTEHLRNQTSSN